MPTADYLIHADAIAAEIAAGRLKPGDRLPPQRTFAYAKGIAVSTASRVYAELLRRGLVVGEVGRGTFVAGRPGQTYVRGEPRDGTIDLEFNFPAIPEQARIFADCLAGLQRADVAASATGPVTARQIDQGRDVVCAFLSTRHWQPSSEGFVFTGSGRQAIAAALAALAPIGSRIAVEALSYPMLKTIAQRIGASLVPIAMDENGAEPAALARAHRKAAISALYVQPVMHNPLGISMNAERRADLVRTARALGIMIIEDMVYGFLSDAPPLAVMAPEQCIVVDSLSKRLAPGLSVGMLHVPQAMRDRVWSIARGGAWTVPSLAFHAAMRLMQDGAAAEIVRLKRRDARLRQAIMAKLFDGFDIAADPGAYHIWLRLPEGWRSEAFAAAAARVGVAVTPSHAFTMAPGHAPNAVRLALGLPSHEELRIAGERLVGLLRRPPEYADVTE